MNVINAITTNSNGVADVAYVVRATMTLLNRDTQNYVQQQVIENYAIFGVVFNRILNTFFFSFTLDGDIEWAIRIRHVKSLTELTVRDNCLWNVVIQLTNLTVTLVLITMPTVRNFEAGTRDNFFLKNKICTQLLPASNNSKHNVIHVQGWKL